MLHGQTRYNIASSFFSELPEALLKRVNRASNYVQHAARSVSTAGDYSAKQPIAAMRDTASPWRIGQSVTHPKFGAGVIVNAEGRGNDARVQVNFNRNGTKWLALEYAKLSAA
jgi:DNA helicase-2/ATP-dependent DNA helicase PcrA